MSIHTGDKKPTVASQDSIWFSTSILHVDPSDHPALKKTILKLDRSYESGFIQEPSVWHHAGRWHMIYAAGAVAGYASSVSPYGPWEKAATAAFGGGVGGLAGAPQHQNIYREGDTLYMTYIHSLTPTVFSQATANVNNPTAWAVNAGFSFDPGAAYRSGGLGNTWTIKVGSEYFMYFEASYGSLGWQTGLAKGPTPAGPFEVVAFPLVSLAAAKGSFRDQMGPQFFTVGNPCVFEQDGEFVMFHSGELTNNGICDIYRSFSKDGINWENRDNNLPIVRRTASGEVDQVVDPMVCRAEDGGWWMFYSQMDNVTTVGTIGVVAMPPALMMFDGNNYVKVSTSTMAAQEWITVPQHTGSTWQLSNRERLLSDTTSASCTATLPRAAQGAKCSVVNCGQTGGANTVTVAAHASDTISNAGSALSVGQEATYECFVQGRWSRV